MIGDHLYAAIDPMALFLSGMAYLIWVEKHHPHVPKVADVQEAVRSMTPEEQRVAVARAQTFAAYGRAVEEAIATMKK